MKPKDRQSGFTLLELIIVIAIAGILTGLAMPSFNSMLERRRLISAAEAVLSDLRWARAESIKRNSSITTWFTSGADWNYEITAGTTPVGCTPEEPSDSLKTVCSADIPLFENISLAQNFFNNGLRFDNVRGVALRTDDNAFGGGSITLTSAPSNFQLRVIVSSLGRVRVCAVGGNIGGYEACL